MPPRKAIPPRGGNPAPPAENPNPSPPPIQHVVEVEDFGRDKDIKNLLKTLQPKAFSGEGSLMFQSHSKNRSCPWKTTLPWQGIIPSLKGLWAEQSLRDQLSYGGSEIVKAVGYRN